MEPKLANIGKNHCFPKNVKLFGNIVNAKKYYNFKYQLPVFTRNAFQFICRTLERAALNSEKKGEDKSKI